MPWGRGCSERESLRCATRPSGSVVQKSSVQEVLWGMVARPGPGGTGEGGVSRGGSFKYVAAMAVGIAMVRGKGARRTGRTTKGEGEWRGSHKPENAEVKVFTGGWFVYSRAAKGKFGRRRKLTK